jgi:hypothetical protein
MHEFQAELEQIKIQSALLATATKMLMLQEQSTLYLWRLGELATIEARALSPENKAKAVADFMVKYEKAGEEFKERYKQVKEGTHQMVDLVLK